MSRYGQYGDSAPKNNTEFRDSQEAALRRLMRKSIRRGGFSKSERDVFLVVMNHWFHHKSGPKDYIHPSRKVIAKKAEVSIRTVATVLSLLRYLGVLVPVSRVGGGRSFATRYRVDELAAFQSCGVDIQEMIDAMTPVKRAKLHGIEGSESVQKLHTVLNDVASSSEPQDFQNIVPFPKASGGDA